MIGKSKVEVGVQVVERWIVAALRKQKFFDLASLNEAIAELLERLNQRRFRKREGSRQSLFETVDRPALLPLPAQRYEFGTWKTATANIDYHVELEHHYYSVPYTLTGAPTASPAVRLARPLLVVMSMALTVTIPPV